MERGHHHQTRGGSRPLAEADFVLQWGSRKRLRCVKILVKPTEKASPTTTARVGRRVVRSDMDPNAGPHCRASHSHRILRNSETAGVMRSPQRQVNGVAGRVMSSDPKKGEEDGRKGGSPAGSDGAMSWPRFELALSNKEKEEDFMIFKGCNKLPQRPKKRAKCIQRTVNLVCPGTWLCELTQERYEVREKKVSKKRPRGLKAMGSMESDSD